MKFLRSKKAVVIMLGGFVLIVGVILVPSGDPEPSYGQLKESCAAALRASPCKEGLVSWLEANQIAYSRRELSPADSNGVLTSNGLSPDEIAQAAYYISFEGLHVSGGGFARHVAYGYFLFSKDDALVNYNLHDIYYGP